MSISNDIELANTREKLERLEQRYTAVRDDRSADPRVRELTMRSLSETIVQFREEIARYLARQPAAK